MLKRKIQMNKVKDVLSTGPNYFILTVVIPIIWKRLALLSITPNQPFDQSPDAETKAANEKGSPENEEGISVTTLYALETLGRKWK